MEELIIKELEFNRRRFEELTSSPTEPVPVTVVAGGTLVLSALLRATFDVSSGTVLVVGVVDVVGAAGFVMSGGLNGLLYILRCDERWMLQRQPELSMDADRAWSMYVHTYEE